jgi:hypothetical protein
MATKKNEETTAIAKPAPLGIASLSSDLPEHLRQQPITNKGLEELEAGDFTMPRLKLAQSSSDEQKEGSPKQIEGLKAGWFFNTLTKEVYGRELVVTPLFVTKSRRLFGPMEQGSPTLCVSLNGVNGGRIHPPSCVACPKSQFTWDEKKNKSVKPECTLFMNYVLVIHSADGTMFDPVALSLKSTMIEAAQYWNSIMRKTGQAAFAGAYKLTSFVDNAGGQSFYNLKVEKVAWLNAEAYSQAERFFTQFSQHRDKIDQTISTPDEVHEAEEVPY